MVSDHSTNLHPFHVEQLRIEMQLLQALVLVYILSIIESAPPALNVHTFDSIIAHKNVLVLFQTYWCKNCKPVQSVFNSLHETLPKDQLLVATLDVEANGSIAHREGIRSYPSIFLYSNGRRWQFRGKRGVDEIIQFTMSHIPTLQLDARPA